MIEIEKGGHYWLLDETSNIHIVFIYLWLKLINLAQAMLWILTLDKDFAWL